MSPNFKAALGAILLLCLLALANFWNVANAADGCPSDLNARTGTFVVGALFAAAVVYVYMRRQAKRNAPVGGGGSKGGGDGTRQN